MIRHSTAPQPEAASATLTKAVLRAAGLLGLSQQALARVLGLSAATVSRMASGQYFLSGGKEWEFAALFVRVFRSLDAIAGNAETARKWLSGDNLGLAGKPIELIQTTEGLVRVLHYLDAHRGRV
jgi:uncharacterized protein (DUF2384 family)